jgi:hypothetical protein
MPHHRLLAWIEPKAHRCTAGFVSAAVSGRPPATRDCASIEEARQWVEDEAAALQVSVVWTDEPAKPPSN